MANTTMEGPPAGFEGYESPMDGVFIIGQIDAPSMKDIPETGASPIHVDGITPIPPEFASLDQFIAQAKPIIPMQRLAIYVDKSEYSKGQDDPFGAEILAGPSPWRLLGIHNEPELAEKLKLLVTDKEPTLFFPTTPEGQPDIGNAWRPEEGQIVAFKDFVFHGPPIRTEGDGERTRITCYGVPLGLSTDFDDEPDEYSDLFALPEKD